MTIFKEMQIAFTYLKLNDKSDISDFRTSFCCTADYLSCNTILLGIRVMDSIHNVKDKIQHSTPNP